VTSQKTIIQNPMKLTPFLKSALEIIRDHPGITAGEFAFLLWPGSNMHRRVSNQGNGACRGKAAWLCGGSHAMKIVHAGLATDRQIGSSYARGYWITKEGLLMLASEPKP